MKDKINKGKIRPFQSEDILEYTIKKDKIYGGRPMKQESNKVDTRGRNKIKGDRNKIRRQNKE